MLRPMIYRSRFALAVALAFGVVASSSLTFAQATNAPAAAPTAPAATPPASPAPAATDTTAASGERPETYTLQQGDTLESVGKQWGLTGRQLQRYNKFTNAQVRKLQIGQTIKIPPAKADKK